MLTNIFLFELQQRLRRISTYVYFVVFFALGCLFALLSGGAFAGASVEFGTGGKVLVNSPYALNSIITYISFFGIVITAAIAGQATYQDIDSNSAVFFYTAPITKLDYLGGRYFAAFALQVLDLRERGLRRVGRHADAMDRQGTARSADGRGLFSAVLHQCPAEPAVPDGNLLRAGGTFAQDVAGVCRQRAGADRLLRRQPALRHGVDGERAGGSGRSVGWLAPSTASPATGRRFSATRSSYRCKESWLRTAPCGSAWAQFSWRSPARNFLLPIRQRKASVAKWSKKKRHFLLRIHCPLRISRFPPPHRCARLLSLTRIQFKETTKNVFFLVLMLAGFPVRRCLRRQESATRRPPGPGRSPSQMLQMASAGFGIFAIAIIIFYSGELVWRERDAQLNQVMDALPLQRWVLFCSKLFALMLVQVVIVLLILAAGLVVQVAQGYFHFELGLYFRELFFNRLLGLWTLCALAMFVQTIVNQKYLGHFVMVLYLIATLALPQAGLQDYLYRYGQAPPVTYSDINGYGPFLQPLVWFRIYWVIAAVLLAIITNLLWVRGTESSWRVRMNLAAARFSRATVAGMAACVVLLFCVGGYIFYNTHILNPYRTTFKVDEDRARYEKNYRQYWPLPQPRITDVKTQIDIYPEQRSASVSGTMWLENKTSSDIDRIALTLLPANIVPLPMPHIRIDRLQFAGGQTALIEDRSLGFYLYKLPAPLPPHGRIQLDFALQYDNPGFENAEPNTDLVHNGSFVYDSYLPYVGYSPTIELTDDSTRHKHGLEKVRRLPKVDDVAAREYNGGAFDADWINFDATVSTSADQIAIAPGYLQKEWVENGRRYFHYKMDAPILDLYSIQSARYAVRRDRWQNVNLEIYYQPGHEFNLDTMMQSMKETLAYCTANFSPFQFHQLRIIEFPGYGTFAESFANTIPFSESIGFITKTSKKPDAVDLPFYVTAHETGHQWWAHQVISAYVQGATSIDETMAQYTALMVMKHHFGPESMQRFLRYELDLYLRGRAQERNEEYPLYMVDPNQGYIHYNKGAMVMYALQDYIGEDKVNEAIREFLKTYAFKGPPYPTSLDLERYFRKVTPPEYQYLFEDMFQNITLYDDRTISADYVKLSDGKYEVDLTVTAKKFRADGRGQEHAIPLHDWLDVGVLDSSGHYLYLQKHKIEQEKTELTLLVDKPPAQAGIDPLNKLIDRNPEDNVVAVKKR